MRLAALLVLAGVAAAGCRSAGLAIPFERHNDMTDLSHREAGERPSGRPSEIVSQRNPPPAWMLERQAAAERRPADPQAPAALPAPLPDPAPDRAPAPASVGDTPAPHAPAVPQGPAAPPAINEPELPPSPPPAPVDEQAVVSASRGAPVDARASAPAAGTPIAGSPAAGTAPVAGVAGAASAAGAAPPATAREMTLLERLARAREDHRRTLEELAAHYTRTGNGLAAARVNEELSDLKRVRKFSYTAEPELSRAYKPGKSIAEADELLARAAAVADKPTEEPDRDRLNRAIAMLQDLLAKYPDSDKVEHALCRLGYIHEQPSHRDYELAVEYYGKAVEADPASDAWFRAARLYEGPLRRGREAADMYTGAAKNDPDPERRRQAAAAVRRLRGQ